MQFCPLCHKEVKYIASKNNVIICDAAELVVYTEFGRKVNGWHPHKCQESKGGEENRNK